MLLDFRAIIINADFIAVMDQDHRNRTAEQELKDVVAM